MPHRNDETLPESQEQFAKLVSGVRDYAVFLLDKHGNVATWNTGAEQIKGYRAEEIIGQHFSRFYTNDSISSGWPAHELSVASATGRFEDEGWRVRKDGSRFWASVVITALRGDEGNVRGFLKITRDMTDRKQAEEKLRLSEERFRLLVEGVKDYAIFMLDTHGRVATWNPGAERLKGYTASEIVGEHFSRFYPPDAIERGWPEEELRRAAADGRVEDEGWRIRKDGSRFWADVVITAMRDEAGVLHGYAKVTKDLTERREAELNARKLLEEEAARKAAQAAAEEIALQREQLQVTLASIGDAVIVTDRQGRVTFLNPIAQDLTGWQLTDAQSKPLAEVFQIINEDSRKPVENPVDVVFRENRIVELANHTAVLKRDGTATPIEDSAAPIRRADGTIDGAILVFRDVTKARRAAEAKQYLAAIVQSSDDAIIGHTLDGFIATWNRGAERLYGYTADEVIGKHLTLLVPDDHPDEEPALLARLRRGEHIEHLETQRVRKDGTRVDVSLTISPVRDEEDRIIGASKIARDITLRKIEDRRKNEFLAVLAHELRNPMAPLRNGLEVLRLTSDNPEITARAHQMMSRQLEHLVHLVDDLLDISRISRDKLQLRKERLPISVVVEHALEVCGPVTSRHDLQVSLPTEALYIDADKTRLAQAICNLLTNAAKYGDPGSRISLAVRSEGSGVLIAIKDQGIGIPPQMLPRVFDMFTQVERSLERSRGGLGVGLAIVKRLVEMHGGMVEGHSSGQYLGSEFVIRLPTVSPPVITKAEGKTELHLSARKRRILVVDDNRDAAETLAMMLRAVGHEVAITFDGRSGITEAEKYKPEVIFLDIGMPNLNGYDAAKSIRSRPWGQSVKLIALTGWGQEEDQRKSLAAGFDLHVIKPMDPSTIGAVLAKVFGDTKNPR